MTLDFRPVAAAAFDAYARAEAAGFGELATKADVDAERSVAEPDRACLVVDVDHSDRAVGTFATYSFEMTVPGTSSVRVGGLTGVSVAPTHRRQGILREMMRRQLDDVAGRGEIGAVLMASQAGIYRRFGYGVATRHARYEIDTTSAPGFDAPPGPRGLRFVDRDEAASTFPALDETWWRRVPGGIGRSEPWWSITLGSDRRWKGGGPLWFVVADPVPETGDPGGYLLFELEERADDALMKRLIIRELHAARPETAAALWRLCFEHDMATSVVAPVAPLDDPVGWRLSDPRALRTTAVSDFLWLRIVDVTAALSSRRYGADGNLTLQISDAFRPETAGTYRLEVTNGVGTCEQLAGAAVRAADLELDIADLGALYLGGTSVTTLVDAGRIVPRDPEVARAADAVLATDRAPFCDTFF